MKHERTVAGLRCSQVLERLSDYLDGELDEQERAAIEAHVTECDTCARFGGAMAEVVRALRERLGAPPSAPEPPAGLARRIVDGLR